MATNITKATLVGTDSTMGLLSDQTLVDQQLFTFPGLDGTFQTPLGVKGNVAVFGGLLRVSAGSEALARAAMKAIIDGIEAYRQLGTELNLFQGGDTSSVASVYAGQYDGVIIQGFTRSGKVSKSIQGANVRMVGTYQLIVRKLLSA